MSWCLPPCQQCCAFCAGLHPLYGALQEAEDSAMGFTVGSLQMQILLEGEEETGSANLPGLLDQKKALLSADLAVSCDGGQISESQGGIPISMRGRISFDLTAQTLSQDVHSGEGPASVSSTSLEVNLTLVHLSYIHGIWRQSLKALHLQGQG